MPAILALATILLASGSGAAQNPQRHASNRLQDALANEEDQLASAEKRQDKSYFQRKLDEGLIFVAYNGLVFTKAKIVESLDYIDVKRYSIKNVKVRALGPDAGLVTYDLLLNGSIAGHDLPSKQYAASVWVKHGANWLLIFHQSTPAHHD